MSLLVELQHWHSDVAKEGIHITVTYRGLCLQYFVAYILGLLEVGYDSRLRDIVEQLVAEQPTYTDLPSNIAEIQESAQKGPLYFSEVAKALGPFWKDHRALSAVVDHFANFVAWVCDAFRKTSGMNVRGTVDFLIANARSILKESPGENLWTLHSVISRVENILRGIYSTKALGLFVDCRGDPEPKYMPTGLAYIKIPAHIISECQSYDPVALHDVDFEAVGPRIDITGFASSAPHIVSIPCGHEYHLKCLDEMVSGILSNSNKCTFYQKQICPPRERRPIQAIPAPTDTSSHHGKSNGFEAEGTAATSGN
ncbi:hypothetical protein K458DRAFT_405145 [Lentithecium fluviatile CBS 122367]|uniref:RING-type domain-containing protein n=1 Tax=Lentithecium fluviatile CBS 122367 TaxID=1168545 RepID=A0A6G1IXJ6_9PLEO|nr:hypothetical protein K458DRAFT_405145 [Lentithecium fluviatile CBS 122367]